MYFADRLKELMEQDGVSSYRLAKEIGCTTTSVTNWLSGKEARQIYIQRMADFFSVSVDFLLGTEKENAPALTKKDERDIDKRLEAVLEDLESGQGGLAFSGEPLDDETRELLIKSLRNSMEVGKALAKKKFTPKRYKKE